MSENATFHLNNKSEVTEHGYIDIVLPVYMSLMCVLCVCGNVVVIIAIAKTKKLQTINSVFLANLAVADVCLGVTLMPLEAHSSLVGEWTFGTTTCKAVTYLVKLFGTISNSSITLIAMDRYLSIIHCLRYTSWSHKLYGSVALVVVWTEAFTLPLSDLTGPLEHPGVCLERLSTSLSHSIIIAVVMVIIPMCIMMFCHFCIIRVARSHSRKIGDINSQMSRNCQVVPSNGVIAMAFAEPVRRLSMMGQPNVNLFSVSRNIDLDFGSYGSRLNFNSNEESRIKREVFAVVRLILLVFVFCGIWFPIVIIEITSYFENRHAMDASRNEFLCKLDVCLIALHCTVNPYMYGLSSKRFRGHVRRMFHVKKDRRETNQTTKLVSIINNRNRSRAQETVGTVNRGSNIIDRKLSILSVPALDESAIHKVEYRKKLRFKDIVSVYSFNSEIPQSISSLDEGVYVDEESQPVKINV